MKTIMLVGVVAFAFIGIQSSAEAASNLRRNETYCLETSLGSGDSGGGGTIIQCNYETLSQCYASRVGHGDSCMLNPVLAFEQRNRQNRQFYR